MSREGTTFLCPQNVIEDGRHHSVNSSLYYGTPYADTESTREVNDHKIEITDKLDGQIVATNTLTTSGDGNILTTVWKHISDNGKENAGQFDSARVGAFRRESAIGFQANGGP
jgi:hypothetical protein